MNPAHYFLDAPTLSDEEILAQINEEIEGRDAVPSLVDEMGIKLAQAYDAGVALAREHGMRPLDTVIEKNAFLPMLAAAAAPAVIGAVGGALKKGLSKPPSMGVGVPKVAMLAAVAPIVARAVGGQATKAVAGQGVKAVIGDMAKDVAKNVAVDKATSIASNALNRGRQQAQQAAPMVQQAPAMSGGFKYANSSGTATWGQKLVGGLVRNPGAALVGAGMVSGAIMAPRDPVTGEKQYMKGALTGGVIGGGAHALGAGNKLRHAIVNPKGPQILGENAGAYAREATKATNVPRSTEAAAARAAAADQARASARELARAQAQQGGPAAMRELSGSLNATPAPAPTMGAGGPIAPHLPPPANAIHQISGGRVSPTPYWNQGPVTGTPKLASTMALMYKLANRQSLSYDPTTKTMTRTHMTPSLASNSLVSGGGTLASPGLAMGDIQAGTTAPVPAHVSDGPRAPLTKAESQYARPAGQQSQAYSLHGGDVMSSTPAPGVAARPQTAPRPIAAPPPIPAAARAAKSPIAAGAGAALRAAPKPPALPSLAGARSLVR